MTKSNTFAAARVSKKDEHEVLKLIKKRFPFASLQQNPDHPLFLNVTIPNKEVDKTPQVRTALRVQGLMDR